MERTRTTALPQDAITVERIGKTYSDGELIDTAITSNSYYPVSGYSTMTDHVIDKFFERRNKGEIFINPLYKHTERVIEAPIDCSSFVLKLNEDYFTNYSGFRVEDSVHAHMSIPGAVISWCESLTDSALTSAFANQTTSKASALVSIGEGKETVVGLVDVFKRLFRIIKAVRKKQYKVLKKELAPAEMADFWMEIRYGIRPIYFDICQIVDALKDTTEVGSRLTSRGHKSYTYSDNDEVQVPNSAYVYNVERTLDLQHVVRAGVLSKVDRIGYFGVLGFADPIEAIYDLTTLSFVIDWFFNVGDTIAAHTPEANLTTLGAWTVETTTTKQTARVTHVTALPGGGPYELGGSMETAGMYERSTTTVVRTPRERASYLPRFNLNLNWAKMVDLCIIGRNIMKTIKSNDVRISRHGRLRRA